MTIALYVIAISALAVSFLRAGRKLSLLLKSMEVI